MMAETENTPLIDPNILHKKNAESSSGAEGTTAVMPAKPAAKPDQGGFIWGTGRRKSAVARVRIRPGSGELKINQRGVEEYFDKPQDRNAVTAPLQALGVAKQFDVFVNVNGGGISSQAGAVRHGIARALCDADENLRTPLKRAGFLTRDDRKVERKKAGFHKARKRPQFSKR